MTSRAPFDVVAAIDSALGIGKDGRVPWHLPGDLAHLVATTKRTDSDRPNAVIMGRKTWESIPLRFRPLRGRRNIVITRDPMYIADDAAVATDFGSSLAIGRAGSDRVFVLGGGEIYAQALDHPDCRRLYLTRVEGDFACDAHFPPFEDRFRRDAVLDEAVENGIAYRIELWVRLD